MPSPRCTFAKRFLSVACFVLFLSTGAAFAQTTTFTYQGRLTDGGTPPTGTYDMQFKLYDTATVGTGSLQGSPNTVTNATVNVASGVFTVQLDFGASGFPGADRFLEINMRHPGDPSYTTLSPRQQLTSTPYAIRALTATNNVLKSGDTMTGTLTVPSLVAGDLAVSSSTKVTNLNADLLDGLDSIAFLQTAGSTMTGPLVLSGNPTASLGAATKQYVDSADALKVNLSGGTMTGTLTLPTNGLVVGANQLVASGGNIGIGATTPSAKLDVGGQIHAGTLTIGSPLTGRIEVSGPGGEISLQDRQSAAWSLTDRWVLYHDTDKLSFYRGSDKMVLDSGGNVGIGVTPGARLDVSAGATSTVPVLQAVSSTDPGNGNPAVSFAITPATNGAILKLEYKTAGGDPSVADKFTALLINSKTGRFIEGWDTLPGTPVKTLDIDKLGNITTAGTVSGNGSGLTNLNGGNLAAGSVTPDKLAPVYGFFYHTLVGPPIPAGGSVPFDQDGPVSGIVRNNATDFQLPGIGVYEVTWQVSINEAGQLLLALNGTDLPSTVVGRYTGTTQIVGNVLIQTVVANSVLTVRAASANSSALTVTAFPGGNTGSLVIKRIK